MMPQKPVLWYAIYVIVIFAVNYFLDGPDKDIISALLVAIISGGLVLLAVFLIDTVRGREG